MKKNGLLMLLLAIFLVSSLVAADIESEVSYSQETIIDQIEEEVGFISQEPEILAELPAAPIPPVFVDMYYESIQRQEVIIEDRAIPGDP